MLVLIFSSIVSFALLRPDVSQFGHGMLCFNAGMKQSGVPLGDVVLPTWAKGDAREFIRAHREVGKSYGS
jgi:hypothetical protein